MTIIDFAETNNLRFVPVVINYTNEIDEDGYNKKGEFYPPKNWKTLAQYAPDKCRKLLDSSSNSKTSVLINLSQPNIIVVDCDEKEAYDRFVELLNEKDLYVETAITKSNRGEKYNIPYKRHFYFNINEVDYENFKKRFTGKYLGKGFDTFYLNGVQILENKNSTLSNIPTISFDDYEYIFDTMKNDYPGENLQPSFEKIQPQKQKKEQIKKPLVDNMDNKEIKNDDKLTDSQVLELILDGIDANHWIGYTDWKIISYIFVNEGLPSELFHKYSKLKCPEKYNYEINQKCLDSNIITSDGYKLETLYYWLKKDNPKLFRELQLQKTDFWKMLKDFNQDDVAHFYYALEPTKYLRSEVSKEWYEYNDYNILKPKGTKPPCSMLNNISKTIKQAIDEQYLNIKPKIIKDANGNTIPDKSYEDKIKLLDKCYKLIGSASFTKGAIEFLTTLYTIENVEKYTDCNMSLFAFNDGCFDIKIGEFRHIQPNDYITKTCGYNYPKKSDPKIKEELLSIISSMFSNNTILEYILKIRGLSLFSDKLQSIFIHTGTGGNGKSMLSILNSKSLGEYFYQADSTFLTSIVSSERANPTLANCKGRRLLAVSEPDDGSGMSKLNAEMIKKLTGSEDLTARDLHKSNITFKPTFTTDLFANNIPKLSKLDGGIGRRLKVINYPFSFVDSPNPNNNLEKQRDYLVQTKFESQDFINEYILLLLEYAVKYYNNDITKLETPIEVKQEIEDYIEENNPLKPWITSCITQNTKSKILCSEVHKHFLESKHSTYKMSSIEFSKLMIFNKFIRSKIGGTWYYKGFDLITENIECDIETL